MSVEEILEEKELDAILVTDEYNFHYLSGFAGEGLLIIDREDKYLVTDSRYTIAAREFAGPKGFTVCEYGAGKPLMRWIRSLTLDKGHSRIGFEDQHMVVSELSQYQKLFPSLEWKPLGKALELLRQVKKEEELEKLRIAESIGDKAFAAILPKIKVGMTELELAAELEYAMKKNGAEGFSFDTIVASGLNSAKPHHRPCSKKLEEGDFITMDFGCLYQGYCSDMTRTVVLGKASEEQKKVYQTVLDAQLTGLKTVKAGLLGSWVDEAARKVIAEAGYGAYFGHSLGHSVGLYIHESPNLSPSEKTVLKAGMIETVEPGIYIEGFGGVRIEDMVIVTENGCENLAHSPKELIEIEI